MFTPAQFFMLEYTLDIIRLLHILHFGKGKNLSLKADKLADSNYFSLSWTRCDWKWNCRVTWEREKDGEDPFMICIITYV